MLFLILNIYTPLIADDFTNSLGINTFNDVIRSQYEYYFGWGGRVVASFFVQFWLLTGKPLFNIANTIIYCLFIIIIQFHITGSFKKINLLLFLILNIFFWFFMPVWGQNFLWLTGSCHYLWTSTIILLFLVPFRIKYDNPDYKLCVPLSVLLLFLGILAGWSVENSGAAVLFLLIAYLIIKVINKDKYTLFEILGIIGFLAGFSLLIAAPGNYIRADVFQQSDNNLFIVTFIKRIVSVTISFIENHGFLIIGISFILGFNLIYHKKQKLYTFTYFYALAAIAGAYSMIVAPYFPTRAFFIVTVFAIITLGNIIRQMNLKIPEIIENNKLFIVIIVFVCLSFTFIDSTRKILAVYLRWYDRIEFIQAEKDKNNYDIDVKVINTTEKHAALYGLDDLVIDEKSWQNTSVASYYGIKSIKINYEPMDNLWEDREKRIRQIIIPPWKISKELRRN